MSQSEARKMARKTAREIAKRGFAKYSHDRRELEVWAKLKLNMRRDCRLTMQATMPRAQLWLIRHIPPFWYERLLGRAIAAILELSSPRMIMGTGLSPWRMKVNRAIPVVLARLLHVFGMVWLVWIRRVLAELGYRMKSEWLDEKRVKVQLWHWWDLEMERVYVLSPTSQIAMPQRPKLWVPGQS